MKQRADGSSSSAHDERATQLRDEMLAVVAHELRDPLHTIAVGLETMLKLQPPGDGRAARQLAVMQRTVRRMNRLILDLLDVTRIEAGNFVVAQEHVQVQPLLNEVLELFDAPARQRSISLTCHAPQAVPCVIGERDRLLRVLSKFYWQCCQVHPGSWPNPCACAADRGGSSLLGGGHRSRDSERNYSAAVRPLLAGEPNGTCRDRARAADREGDRGSTWGADLGRERPGSRDDVSFHGCLCTAKLSVATCQTARVTSAFWRLPSAAREVAYLEA